jgi:hypothetical protein
VQSGTWGSFYIAQLARVILNAISVRFQRVLNTQAISHDSERQTLAPASSFNVNDKGKWIAPVMIGCALLLAVSIVLSLVLRRSEEVGLNHEILTDDFGILVRGFHESHGVGLADITVTNHAKRVEFDFDPSLVKVIDSDGGVHVGSPVQGGGKTTLAPGQSHETTLSFDLAGKNPQYLKWNFGGAIGGFLDDLLFGDRRIALNQ